MLPHPPPVPADPSSVPDELEHYLQEKQVHDLFIRLVEKLLLDKPDNVTGYIVGHLLDHYPEQTAAFTRKSAAVSAAAPSRSLDESTVSADDEVFAAAPPPAQPVAQGIVQARRGSISAAPLTAEEAARPPEVFAKSAEDAQRIESLLKESWVTSSLSKEETSRIVDAMERVDFEPGQEIIRNGDAVAEHYFVVDRGTADVTDDSGQLIRTCNKGDSFGELALLYNTPRCATVTAGEEGCSCWRLGRVTFKSLVINAAVQRRERYKAFLASVPLLAELPAKDKLVLADTLQAVSFPAGAVVVAQGGKGDAMYLVLQGRLQATRDDSLLDVIGSGDYFGELALLNPDANRSCTVTALENCELLRVRKEVFLRILVPTLGETMRRRVYKFVAPNPAKQASGGSGAKKKKKRAQAALDSSA